MSNNPLLTAALQYASVGWHVFPIYSIKDGKCSCGQADCDPGNAGKHPRITGWTTNASIDPKTISVWWQTWPTDNIGIATGALSNLVAVDTDSEEGETRFKSLMVEHGVPLTRTIKTFKGRHRLFNGDHSKLVASRNGLEKNIDIRGNGGFIVAPPSKHLSGIEY